MTSDRFDGAITTPTEPTSEPPAPTRPPRPPLIEAAAAILVVGGLTGLATGPSPFQPDIAPLAWLLLALNIATIVVGLLVRAGRAWVLALNVTAIALFLELTALPSPIALLFALLDGLVLVALIRHRAWFEWSPSGHIPD
jgi:hypothetical protein